MTERVITGGLCLMLAGLLIAAVGAYRGAPGSAGWALVPHPEEPRSGPPAVWPPPAPNSARVLAQAPQLGLVLAEPDALWITTGHGLLRMARDGSPPLQTTTPGRAQSVVRQSPALLWVADGQAGVTPVTVVEGGLMTGPSHPVGDVTMLATAGEWTLAALREGWVASLRPGPDGELIEGDRQVVDGRPKQIVTWGEDGARWAVALAEGGVLTGSLDDGGQLEIDEVVEYGYTTGIIRVPDGLLWTGPTGAVRGTAAGAGGSFRARVTVAATTADGVPWFSVGDRVFRGAPAALGAVNEPVRARPGNTVAGLAAEVTGPSVVVTWSDGRVEALNVEGSPTASWMAPGVGGSIERVGAGLFARRESGGDWLEALDGSDSFRIRAAVSELVESASGALIAARETGVHRWNPPGPPQSLGGGNAAGVAAGLDGTLWTIESDGGLVHRSPSGEVLGMWPTSHQDANNKTVALSPRWAFAAGWAHGAWLAVDRTDGTVVRGWLGGRGSDAIVLGDVVVVGLGGYGLLTLDLASQPPTTHRLPLPIRTGSIDGARLCPAPGGVLVTMLERGVARVHVASDGAMTLGPWVDTPGLAQDCAATDQPETWLVADSTSLLELTIPLR